MNRFQNCTIHMDTMLECSPPLVKRKNTQTSDSGNAMKYHNLHTAFARLPKVMHYYSDTGPLRMCIRVFESNGSGMLQYQHLIAFYRTVNVQTRRVFGVRFMYFSHFIFSLGSYIFTSLYGVFFYHKTQP